jgi:NAD(P)-dependent dehydrogenase (short-subunit alcohol dehydrogenase family)
VEAFEDLVPATGTIAVMSSILGSVSGNEEGGWEVYRSSKSALNSLVRSFAARHPGDKRTMLLVVPGWVRTEMGGPEADLSIEESIPGVVDMVTRETGTPGLRYKDYRGLTIPW